ncbi:MAG: M48 family metallopeptidase [Planctomycetes bacterium]|nr:M48 family metallopeptidase [Planctomycetota bacterium]
MVCRISALALLALVAAACGTVEETQRSQFVLPFLTDDVMASLGADAYAEATGQYPVVTGTAEAAMVERVGQRIARASGRDYQWQFKLLLAPDEVNAFCLPGGKVAVFSGILPVCGDEDGLAVVIGHEIAHATSRHGAERMSQELVAQLAIGLTAVGLEQTKWNDETKGLVLLALGAGAQVGFLLPYSRDHESEADEIGLRFAIRAGYDPAAAPPLWERMAKLGDQGPEFLSTHPDPLARAQRLRELTPRLLAEERANARGY